jgi:hypothetical protein
MADKLFKATLSQVQAIEFIEEMIEDMADSAIDYGAALQANLAGATDSSFEKEMVAGDLFESNFNKLSEALELLKGT